MSRKKLDQLNVVEPSIRKLCVESLARHPFPNAEAVYEHFRDLNRSGDLERTLSAEITRVLIGPNPNGLEDSSSIRNEHLRHVARTFYFERVLHDASHNFDEVIDTLTARLQNGSPLKRIDDPSWPLVIDMARGLLVAGFGHPKLFTDVGIGKELRKMYDAGFPIEVSQGNIWIKSEDQIRVTSKILAAFQKIGLMASLDALFAVMKRSSLFRDQQYLFPRVYVLAERPPSIPFNFLLNIAVKSSALSHKLSQTDFASSFTEAIELGRQLAAVADVEPYSQWHGIFVSPEDVEVFLRDTAIYDHLFTLRQWPPKYAVFLIENFFGTGFNSLLLNNFGWDVPDVIALLRRLTHLTSKDPLIVTPKALAGDGLPVEKVQALLVHFSHPSGRVNADYSSPLTATKGDLFFRPLTHIHSDTYILPALSIGAYATFEATLTALRGLVKKAELSELSGHGTERIVRASFARASLNPTIAGETYEIDGEEGECDLVFEDAQHILFVECKAKPLTRAAMAGTSGEALMDFTGGILHSQGQALRHERILRKQGHINFESGYQLRFENRKVLRLSVTLMDLGALQDRSTFIHLYEQLARIEVAGEPGYAKRKELENVNEKLLDFRHEVIELDRLGENARSQALRTLCLGVGQLVLLLDGASDLTTFIKRMPLYVMTGSGNALIDYYRFKEMGMFKSEEPDATVAL